MNKNKANVAYEDITKRTYDSKHYQMTNGNEKIVLYAGAVHCRSGKDNQFEEIDAQLQAVSREGVEVYENQNENFFVQVMKDSTADKQVRMNINGHSLAWGLLGRTAVNGDKENKRNIRVRLDEKQETEDCCKGVTFADVLENVDIAYSIIADTVKENIIVKEKRDNYQFEFMLYTDLQAQPSADGSCIYFADEQNQRQCLIPAPFMEDANGIVGENVFYEMRKTEGGYLFTVTAHSDWMNAPERAFPVIIDPMIQQYSSTGFGSTTVSRLGTDKTTQGAGSTRPLGVDSTGRIHRVYLKPNVRLSSAEGKILRASLNMHGFTANTAAPVLGFALYRLKAPVSNINWDTLDAAMDTQVLAICNNTPNASGFFSFDIAEYCTNVLNGTWQQYGLVIRPILEDNKYNNLVYISTGSVTSTHLEIEYLKENSAQGEAQAHSCGRAGEASVNLSNGLMTFVHADVGIVGSKLPISLMHVFSKEVLESGGTPMPIWNATKKTYMGNGWRLNYQQYLYTNILSTNQKYVYIDGSGVQHYFEKTGVNSDGKAVYADTKGTGMYITDGSNSIHNIPNGGHTLSMYFNKNGTLSLIHGIFQLIDFTYQSDDPYKLESISDMYGRKLLLHYNADGLLESIDTSAGREQKTVLRYNYDSANNLTEILYADDTKSTYAYNSNGLLSLVTDPIQYSLSFSYDDTKRTTTVAAKHGAEITQSGIKKASQEEWGKIEYEYQNPRKTVIENQDGVRKVYLMDEFGMTYATYEECTDPDFPARPAHFSDVSYGRIHDGCAVTALISKNGNKALNSRFNYYNGNSITSWTRYTNGNIDNSSNFGSITDQGAVINGTKGATRELHQSVSRSTFIRNKIYSASAWAKADSASLPDRFSIRRFELRVEVKYADGTAETFRAPFDTRYTDWQPAAVAFTVKDKTLAEPIKLILSYSDNLGQAIFDNVIVNAGSASVTIPSIKGQGEEYLLQNLEKVGFLKTADSAEEFIYLSDDYTISASDLKQTLLIYDRDGIRFLHMNGLRFGTAFLHRLRFYFKDVASPLTCSQMTLCTTLHSDEQNVRIENIFQKGVANALSAIGKPNDFSNVEFAEKVISTDKNQNSATSYTLYDVDDQVVETIGYDGTDDKYHYNMDGIIALATSQAKSSCGCEYEGFYSNESEYNLPFVKSTESDYDRYNQDRNYLNENGKLDVYKGQDSFFEHDPITGALLKAGAPVSSISKVRCKKCADLKVGENESIKMVSHAQQNEYDSMGNHITQKTECRRHDTFSAEVYDADTYTHFEGEYHGGLMTQVKYGFSNSNKNFQHYAMAYNGAGLLTNIKQNYFNLVSNSYKKLSSGMQQTTKYYNSASSPTEITVVSDKYGRPKQEKLDGTVMVENKYNYRSSVDNASSPIRSTIDNYAQRKYNYNYNSFGESTGVTTTALDGTAIGTSFIEQDCFGNVTALVYTFPNTTLRYEYTYETVADRQKYLTQKLAEDTNTSAQLPGGAVSQVRVLKDGNEQCVIKYEYDLFGRLRKKSAGGDQEYLYLEPSSDYLAGEGVGTNNREYDEDRYGGAKFKDDQGNGKLIDGNVYLHEYTDYSGRHASRRALPLVDAVQCTPTTFADKEWLRYTYDVSGRIASTFRQRYVNKALYYVDYGSYVDKMQYNYDDNGSLLRTVVTPFEAESTAQVYEYQYDDNGNRLSKQTYSINKQTGGQGASTYENYSYNDDRLVSVSGRGSISYDNLGNPTSYFGKSMTWTRGSLLSQYGTSSYTYDCSGIRVQKTANGRTHKYFLEGDRIVREEIYSGSSLHTTMLFMYGPDGVTGYIKNGTPYVYEKNLQGDIIAFKNVSGSWSYTYKYDEWGNVINDDSYDENPFRYRGYYYDSDTGLYYCGSRYYDPSTGRFISPDDVSFLAPTQPSGLNLYAYCGNDPVNRVDSKGHFWDYILDAGFLAWSIADVVRNPGDWKNWAALGIDLVFAVIPFIPSGAGQFIKAGNKIDNALDVASAINQIDNIHDLGKVTMIGRSMDRVTDTAKLIGKADDLYDAWKGYGRVGNISMPIANGLSAVHNGGWLLKKLRKGYTVIDIGITTEHIGRGIWYGTERFVSTMWRTRNIWKFPVNYCL